MRSGDGVRIGPVFLLRFERPTSKHFGIRRRYHAICEEYRAAATIDFARDTQDREDDRQIMYPALVLWSEGSGLDTWYAEAGGPLGIWSDWATDVRGRPISGGHFFPEQNSTETISELSSFFMLG